MTAPIHTRPFDMTAAKAGAPYCCRDGGEATVLKWNGRRETYPLIGICGEDDQVITWTNDGLFCVNDSGGFDLVMLPLGYIDGKPVFVGDIIKSPDCKPTPAEVGMCFSPGSTWYWPAPEKVYPETRAHWDEFMNSIDSTGPRSGLTINERQVAAIANAAIRHAIDAGQVITKEDHEAALVRLGESLRPVADAARAERDMAVAQAVESEMRAAGEQMAARRSARDMAVAQATKKACLVILAGEAFGQAPVVSYNHICAIDLTAIIAEVAP